MQSSPLEKMGSAAVVILLLFLLVVSVVSAVKFLVTVWPTEEAESLQAVVYMGVRSADDARFYYGQTYQEEVRVERRQRSSVDRMRHSLTNLLTVTRKDQ